MKYLIGIIAALALAGFAHAQVIGGVVGGYGQVVGAESSSTTSTVGGSGAAILGLSATQVQASNGNVSGAQATQSLGTSTVITESLSGGSLISRSGALGLSGAASAGGGTSGGSAGGIAGQGALGGIGFILP